MPRLPTLHQAVRRFTPSRERCAGCGRPLSSQLVIKDVDPEGALAAYHQACAPSLGQRSQ